MIKLLLFQTATTIVTFLTPVLGIIAPFITQFIKNKLKLQGNGALILTLAISAGLATFGAWSLGMFVLEGGALATAIFTASTVIYKFIIANDTVQANLPEFLKN